MNDVPPGREEPDDVDDAYRRESALDPSRPSELVRRRILKHAAERAAERAGESDAAGIRRRGASSPWRRPAIFGTLAAAALAGLLITPRFFMPHAPSTAATSSAQVQRPSSAIPSAPTEQTEERAPVTAADEQPSPPAEEQGVLKPQAFARNDPPSRNSGANLVAKNAPAKTQSMAAARKSAADSNSGAATGSASVTGSAAANDSPAANDRPAANDSAAANDSLAADSSRLQAMSGAARSAARSGAPASLFSDPAAQLRQAAATGDMAELQALLDKQTQVDARDAGGRTALMLATLQGQGEAVDVLLAHGADPNAADSQGTTPLQAANAGGRQSIATALQRAGAR
jgi:hypothetical protein